MKGETVLNILTILILIYVIWIFSMEIRRSPLRGVFLVLLSIGGAALSVFGKRFGFDGNIAAVIYLIIMLAMAYCYQYIIHKNSHLKDKDKFWLE